LDERNHQSIGSTKRLKNEQQRPVWPDWAKFRLLVYCLLWCRFTENCRSITTLGATFS
jgi:hypothetical protein